MQESSVKFDGNYQVGQIPLYGTCESMANGGWCPPQRDFLGRQHKALPCCSTVQNR
jgi:hypothetical protein